MRLENTHRITLFKNRLHEGYEFECPMVLTPEKLLEMLRLYEAQICGLSYEDIAPYEMVCLAPDPLGGTFIVRTCGLGPRMEQNVLISGAVEEIEG